MRIIIYFKNTKKPRYKQNQLSGLVYRIIKNSGYSWIHDIPQKYPRFFSFSQLFLAKNKLALIFASPIRDLVISFKNFLNQNKLLSINKSPLLIDKIITLKYKFEKDKPIIIKTETPVIVRIPKEKFQEYGLNFEKEYKYFYWRPLKEKRIPLEPFTKQLEARIYKNFKLFTGKEDIKEIPIFIQFKYIKAIDLPIYKNNKKISQPGTLWEFTINPEVSYNLVNFILDTGLGELNSQGYGFVSLKKNGVDNIK